MSRAVPDTENKVLNLYGWQKESEWPLTSPQNGWWNARNKKASEQISSSTHSGWNYQSAGFNDGSERRRQPQCFVFISDYRSNRLHEIGYVEEELDVVLQLYVATLKLFLCRLFSCFALFCSHPALHYIQLCHRHCRPMCGCPGSPLDMVCSRPHIGLWRAEHPARFVEALPTPRTLKYGRNGWTQEERQSERQ